MYFSIRASDAGQLQWAEATKILNLPYALVFTIILVLSSVTCQLGVFRAERGDVFGLRRWFTSTFLMGLTFALAAASCNRETQSTESASAPAADAPIRERTVQEVATLLESGGVTVVDANHPQTRTERGIIPGARLLTSSSQYDPARELPADRNSALVFYCGGVQCRASDGAARRAANAGYRDVSVLRAGIAGWREAGRPTAQPPRS